MYPVGIGPKGIESTYGNPGYIKRGPTCAENKGLFFGQRTNGAYALVNMAPRWYTTYDREYGHKGVLRVFPVWPKDKDAAFTDIRCWDAFLVSGELKDGRVTHVNILSEQGRDLTLVNPWA